MKTLVASLLIVFAASHALASGEYISCMQIRTNDPFLPNLVTLYPAQDGALRVKFQIEGDERQVVAAKLAENDSAIQFGNVRLLEDGAIKGGPIGIKFHLQKSALVKAGQFQWKYFDGSEATYACSVN